MRAWYFYFGAVLSLTIGLSLGIWLFPQPYDWQYQVVSLLASRVENPKGYKFFCLAMALAFGLIFPLGGYLRTKLEHASPRLVRIAGQCFRLGVVAAILVSFESALIHSLSDHLYKGHEIIALLGFVGFFVGITGFWFATYRWLQGRKRSVWLAVLFFLAVGPIFCTAASQLYLYVTPHDLGWVDPHWRQLGVPPYLSFAFWQWLTSVGFFVYLGILLYLLREPTH